MHVELREKFIFHAMPAFGIVFVSDKVEIMTLTAALANISDVH
jgi:hypothetical protein